MKSKSISLLILIAFAIGCMYLLDSCSSSNHSASYPVIHKLKNEKFAKNIKHKNKTDSEVYSKVQVQTNENQTNIFALNEKEPDEILILPEKFPGDLQETTDSSPDIASVNNDIIYSNNSIIIDDQFFKAYYHHYKNSYKSYRQQLSEKKSRNHSEFDTSNSRRGNGGMAFGIISLASGIIGLFFFPILFGAVAIVFGAIGLNKKLKGLSIAGLILGIICVVLGIIILALAL